jgi:hypothetical protein
MTVTTVVFVTAVFLALVVVEIVISSTVGVVNTAVVPIDWDVIRTTADIYVVTLDEDRL